MTAVLIAYMIPVLAIALSLGLITRDPRPDPEPAPKLIDLDVEETP